MTTNEGPEELRLKLNGSGYVKGSRYTTLNAGAYFKDIMEMFKSCNKKNQAEVERTLALTMKSKCYKCNITDGSRYTISIPNGPNSQIPKFVEIFNSGEFFKACCDNAEIHF